MATHTQLDEFLKLAIVIGLTGRSRSAIYAAIKAGTFPAPVKIGVRSVAWTAASIADWQKSRIEASQEA